MRSFALALLLAAITPVAVAQETSPKVSFSCRAARVANILDDLSKATNLKLTASPQTADEILIVSASDVPVSQLLSHIAQAASAEWQPIEGGYKLAPAVGIRTREENDALALRVVELRKSIAKHLEKPKVQKGQPGTAPDVEETGLFGVQDAPTYQILAQTDLTAVASLRNGERVVFSTTPTRTQRRFAGDITASINSLIAAHNKQVASNPEPTTAPEMDKIPDFMKQMIERMSKPIGKVSKVLFIVSRMGFGVFGMTQGELRLYDPDGKVAFTTPVMLDMPGGNLEELMQQVGAVKPPAPGAKPEPTTLVEQSADTKAFLGVFSSGGMTGMQGLKISGDIATKIFRPDLYDPLSFLPTDQVYSLAKKRKMPVVAVLPDDVVSLLTNVMPNQKLTVEQFEKQLAKGSEARITEDNGWLVIKPARPSESRANRLDRGALAQLLAATKAKGIPSLDDVAAYALRAPSPMEGGLGALYVMYLVPGAFSQSLSGFTSWETLRFYGSLDSIVRKNMELGGRVQFAGLTSYQQEQVRRMAFGSMGSLQVEEPGKKVEDTPVWMRSFMGGAGSDYRTEPSEILPNGIPGDGWVEMKVSSEPFASAVMPEGRTAAAPMAVLDADMLAMFKMMKEDTNMSQFAAMMPSPSQVRIGQKANYAITFHVAPNVSMHQTLSDHSLPKDAPVVSMQNLPADFQKLIAERQAALKKSPFGALMGMAGMFGGAGAIKP